MTNDESFVLGYALGNNNGTKNIIDNGNFEFWSPPDDWIPVPEPTDNEAYYLINSFEGITLSCYTDVTENRGTYTVNWGDGIINTYDLLHNARFSHTYTAKNTQYLVKLTFPNLDNLRNFYMVTDSSAWSGFLIAKIGKNMTVDLEMLYCSNGYSTLHELTLSKWTNQGLSMNLYNIRKLTINSEIAQMPDCFLQHFEHLERIIFPHCTNISMKAFYECHNLREVIVPNCLTIGEWAFGGCENLQHIDMPNCTIVDNCAFQQCYSLSDVKLPNCITIAQGVFQNCDSLHTIELPNCANIGYEAFAYCYALERVCVPNCTIVNDKGFYDCSNLIDFIASPNCSYGKYCFEDCDMLYPKPNE